MGDTPNRGPGRIPERWLRCPRKAEDLLDKFLAFKTPLDKKFDEQVPLQYRFTPNMLFDHVKARRFKLGLWIDLTRTSRFYDKDQVESQNCGYLKIECHGAEGAPTKEQTKLFINVCERFLAKDPINLIGVHCTHGFNRTGFLIASFLIEHFDFSVEGAVREFAKVRPPGIYKEGYIRELYTRYLEEVPSRSLAPPLPDWCYDGESSSFDSPDSVSSPATPGRGRGGHNRRSINRFRENPTFMDGISGVDPIVDHDEITRIRCRVAALTGNEERADMFVGSQPVSMDQNNMHLLAQKPYRVSWKADGTRYMMLIAGEGEVYFLDRDNSVFRVRQLRFYSRDSPEQHLTNTLVDGEMVIDVHEGNKYPRYLIYDLVVFQGQRIGEKPFYPTRYIAIEKEIIQPRIEAMKATRIVREEEPFSVRIKHFYELPYASHLLGEKFAKQLAHAPDGLIFQPSEDCYVYGTASTVLKWKPQSLNSIDFRLQVKHIQQTGCLPEYRGALLTGSGREWGQLKCDRTLRTLHGKIIECKLENNKWVFMRERTDKSFPNADKTAEAVLESIRAPVTRSMLLEFIKTHAFKESMPPPLGPPPVKKARTM